MIRSVEMGSVALRILVRGNILHRFFLFRPHARTLRTFHPDVEGVMITERSARLRRDGSRETAVGTWLRRRASCRDAEPQYHQKVNNKLELYSVENALSKRKQL